MASHALALFIAEASRYPLLSQAEEAELGRRVQSIGDQKAAQKLVKHNFRLVIWMARRYTRPGLQLDDLIQWGNIGLMIAAQRYDPAKSRFTTYAYHWIRQSVLRNIQDRETLIRVPVYRYADILTVHRTAKELTKELGREPVPEEIARRSGISIRRVGQALQTGEQRGVVTITKYLDVPDTDEYVSSDDVLPDIYSMTPEDILLKREELKQRRLAVITFVERVRCSEALSSVQKEIFLGYFGLRDTREPLTMEDLGGEFGITRERVRQIINRVWRVTGRSEHSYHLFRSALRTLRGYEEFMESV